MVTLLFRAGGVDLIGRLYFDWMMHTKEVDKMIKWGAVVDCDDHDALVDYLSANFNPDQPPPYDPPRSAPQRTGAGKQSK